jgi:hypothetical protein
MCAVCVSPALEGWPIFILCGAGVQRREGQLTETLRSCRVPFQVVETVRGGSLVGWRSGLHRRAWRQIIDQDLPGAIIIEDGARLKPGFVEFLASGGYLHADLTQFCYCRARVWRWGGAEAAPGVKLQPLAASSGLAAGYSLSRRGAGYLLEAPVATRANSPSSQADWPRDVARLDALVTRPGLVDPPDWLLDSAPAPLQTPQADRAAWLDLPAATLPQSTADRLRGFARNSFSRELSHGF